MDPRLKIEYLPTKDLVPYAHNAKEHPAWQVEQIAESIKQFGNCDPIAVWHNAEGRPEIVEGHGRLMALELLGIDKAPTISLDHLDDDARRAYTHVHNQTTMSSGFDLDILQADLESIEGFDWEAFGFEAPDTIESVDFQDTDIPEVDEEPRTKPGDVWEMGGHRLVCGDSTDPETYRMLMGEEQADLIVTDPPYNVDYIGKTAERLTIDNDVFASPEDYLAFLTDAFTAMASEARPGAAFYIWHATRYTTEVKQAAKDAGLSVRQTLVWNKSIFVLGRQDYQWKHEPCLYGWKTGAAHYFVKDRTLSTVWTDPPFVPEKASKDELRRFAEDILASYEPDVWDEKKPSRSELHPTMKPVPLIGRCVVNSSRRGELVLDPFGGSGSTLLACEQAGRRCRTIELDPHYCDVIVARWEEYTGKEAERR